MTEERKVSRRTFISGTIGGLVVGAVAGGVGGYYSAPKVTSPGATTTVTTTAVPTSVTSAVAKQILNHVTFLDPSSMDPHKANDEPTIRFTSNLYDPLVQIVGQTGFGGWVQMAPHLAKSWTVSSDGTEYVFEIRKGVPFHDGSILDANAVKYSIDRALVMNTNLTAQTIKPFVSNTAVTGNYEVKVTLSTAYAPFISVLPTLFIVNPKLVEANINSTATTYGAKGDYGTAWLETNDAGSGPYVLTQRKAGEVTVFERFPDNWEGWGPKYFDELNYQFNGEAATLVSKLKDGTSDWCEYWLGQDSFNDLAKSPGVTVAEWSDLAGTFTILMNNQNKFLKNKLVRQAISYAFDYDSCIKNIWGGHGVPSTGPIPPGMMGYNPSAKMYSRDINKAKALLAQSGYKPGDITIDITWGTGQDIRRLMSILLQQNLAEIGITLQLKELPWNTFIEGITTSKVEDVIAMSHLAGSIAFPDPDYILHAWYYSPIWEVQGLKTYYTMSFYKNPDVDKLIEQGAVTTDPGQRNTIYQQATAMIIDDAASLWPVWNNTEMGIRSDIEGFTPLPFYFTNFNLFRRNRWFRITS